MNLMKAMMFSCVKATELMELKEEAPLSFIQNMQLKMHVALCSGCRNYMKQSALIDKLLDKDNSSIPLTGDTTDLEASIIDKL